MVGSYSPSENANDISSASEWKDLRGGSGGSLGFGLTVRTVRPRRLRVL